eukprot:291775-Pleurochrysis_carterae.AAC.1
MDAAYQRSRPALSKLRTFVDRFERVELCMDVQTEARHIRFNTVVADRLVAWRANGRRTTVRARWPTMAFRIVLNNLVRKSTVARRSAMIVERRSAVCR